MSIPFPNITMKQLAITWLYSLSVFLIAIIIHKQHIIGEKVNNIIISFFLANIITRILFNRLYNFVKYILVIFILLFIYFVFSDMLEDIKPIVIILYGASITFFIKLFV